MMRKLVATAALVVLGLFGSAGIAAATTTPPVNNNNVIVLSTSAEALVLGTSQVLPSTSSRTIVKSSNLVQVMPASSSVNDTSAGALSYTGVSFNVPLTLTIAALVVLGGFVLVFFGGRGVSRSRRQH